MTHLDSFLFENDIKAIIMICNYYYTPIFPLAHKGRGFSVSSWSLDCNLSRLSKDGLRINFMVSRLISQLVCLS